MHVKYMFSVLLFSAVGFAQVDSLPAKTQKYNGYGLPNTKFKKIKIDLSKKRPQTQQFESISAPPAKINFTSMPQSNNVVTQIETKPEVKAVQFGFSLSSGYNRQAEKQADGSLPEYYMHELTPSLKIGEYTAMGVFYYYDDIKNPSANEWQDSVLAATKKAWNLGNYFTLAPGISLGLPLAKATREIGLKNTLGTSLTLGLNTKNMGAAAWTLNYSLGYTKMTNEFETNPKGEPITSYRVRQRINIGYSFTDALSFQTRFQFDSATSYSNVIRNSFLHFQVLEYSFNDHVSANIGHANGAGAFIVRESETDYYLENNIKFYDPKSSEYSIGLTLSI